MQVFLSHSSENSATAQEICEKIEQRGYSCFLAPRDIRSGHEYAEEIVNGIDNSDVMLLLLSEQANSSPHVLREIERAVSKKIAIVVYKLEEVQLSKSMEYFLMTHQWLDTEHGGSYDKILGCLDEFAEKRGAEVTAAASDKAEEAEKPQSYSISENAEQRGERNLMPIIFAALSLVLIIVGAVVMFNLLNKVDESDKLQSRPTPSQTTEATTTASNPQSTTTAATEQTTASSAQTEATSATVGTTSEPAEQTAEATSPAEEVILSSFEVGDRITLGKYNGEDITWRVIGFDENGGMVVIANDILTMKCFDAAESGKYNALDGESYWNVPESDLSADVLVKIRGNNSWAQSNIRAWLNSDRENVIYSDQPPTIGAMSELSNAYNTEIGFLNSFTEEELAAILTTEVVTGNDITYDKVYLLAEEELSMLEEADVSRYAKPTAAAKAQDKSAWYQLYVNEYGVADHYWWLRTADESAASSAKLVTNSLESGTVVSRSVGLEGYGIRPVMMLDPGAAALTAE